MSKPSLESSLKWLALVTVALMPAWLVWGRAIADIAVSSVALMFLLRCARERDWGWARDGVVAPLLLLWLWLCAMYGFSFAPLQSLNSLLATVGWVRFPLFFVALTHWLLRDKQDAAFVGKALLLFTGLIALDALWQYVTHMSLTGKPMRPERLTGPFSKPTVGIMIAKIAFPAFALFALKYHASPRAMRAGALALGLAALLVLLSGERSATLMMFASLGLLAGIVGWKMRGLRRPLLGGALALLLLVAALYFTQESVRTRAGLLVDHLQTFGDTPYGQLWKTALLMGSAHFPHGAGVEQFFAACQPFQAAGQVTYCDIHPHNLYLEWLALGGLPALLLFGLWVIRLTMRHIRLYREGASVPLFAASCAVLLINLSPLAITQSNFSNWAAALTWTSLGLGYAAMKLGSRK